QEGYAMIGHGGDSSDAQGTGFDGNVSVTATTGDIVLTSNTPAGSGGNRTFAKIGHGGYVSAAADYSGNVTATATAGSILGTAGVDGNNNYVQIGHGGIANHATTGHTGTINVLAANDITFTGGIDNAGAAGNDREFAMIGHGGANSDGNHSGNVTVEAGTDGTGSVTFQAGNIRGTTEGPFAQIGHGGQSHNGDLGGNISVTAATDISMLGGIATDGAYAQIGHGGRSAKGDRTGTISATATNGKVDVIAGLNNNNYAQIGHGGHEGDFTGATGGTTAAETITVTAGTTINVVGAQTDADVIDGIANGAAQSYAQIGHGGQYADGNHLATITVNAGTDLAVTAGLSNQTYAQIGHGGLFNGGGGKGNQAGDIDIDAGGDISVAGGVRERAYAQIGHGGFD
ncbi:MAG: hypothetical protein MI807_20200, partial [Verrucomicrobiales bacterium]|nr:hypothetical protein [Verrucomicrobiales bacterium]